jgi:hypothetical protein
MKLSFKGLTGAAALLAAALGLSVVGPHRAYAAPGNAVAPGDSDLGVTILNPDPHTPLSGLKPVEISAFYQGSPANQIIAVELYLDGVKAATKTLDVPETRGVVSFLVDASQVSAGTHRIVVRATAADQEVKSARSSFSFGSSIGSEPLLSGQSLRSNPAQPLPSGATDLGPTLHLFDPSENGKVQGMVTLRVNATDPSGKPPYVSLFVDKTFKTLRNFAPYEFDWDTTGYSNGYHTIEMSSYNEAGNAGQAKSLRLYVNNPGGETSIRHDLLDGVKTVKSSLPRVPTRKPAAHKALGRPLPLRRPDLLTAVAVAVKPAQPRLAAALTRLAAALPTHLLSTRESVQMLVRGASAVRFGDMNVAGQNIDGGLTNPFVNEKPAANVDAETPAPRLTPSGPTAPRRLKSLPVGMASPDAAPNTASLPETGQRISGKAARLQRMATLRLPESHLTLPFLAVPHAAPRAIKPVVKIVVAPHEARIASAVIKPVLKMHTLRVHLPATLGSLLRSVGQTSVLFNHTTVKMDRPLAEQNNILFGPLRQIFEQGGGTLTWQSRTGTVHAKNATKDITLTIGSASALVNTKQVALDGKPYLIMGRTMVPMSFVTAAMDADVQYDAATGHLLITSRK